MVNCGTRILPVINPVATNCERQDGLRNSPTAERVPTQFGGDGVIGGDLVANGPRPDAGDPGCDQSRRVGHESVYPAASVLFLRTLRDP